MKLSSNKVILLVEDCPEDYEATMRAFKRSNLKNPIFRCKDGQEALDYLYHKNQFQDRDRFPKPCIILLDLNLPKVDGKEVLLKIKSDKEIKSIPVIVLTTSDDEIDIQKCYEYGANCYIQKPVDLLKFFDAIQKLSEYWFEVALLLKE
jgi:CheY-like chemotaxis protein